jgi:hypothetical protein
MSGQPIVFQVLSPDVSRFIRRRMKMVGLVSMALLSVAMLAALKHGQDKQGIMITGAMVLFLTVNGILLFRNRLIDRFGKSICVDGELCYVLMENGDTHLLQEVHFRYRKDVLVFKSEVASTPKTNPDFVFQVLYRRTWDALKELRLQQEEVQGNHLVFS